MLPLLPPIRRRLATTPLPSLIPPYHPPTHIPPSHPHPQHTTQTRPSSSSQNWIRRAHADHFANAAKVKGLKSRAAWKLIQMDEKYRLFRKNQCVVDLGFAPGSWTQVAVERTQPRGRVLGIDLLMAMPPRGASAIQGNFLDPGTRELVRGWVVEVEGRRRREVAAEVEVEGEGEGGLVEERPSYIDMERAAAKEMEGVERVIAEESGGRDTEEEGKDEEKADKAKEKAAREKDAMLKSVDIVLSDMYKPWALTHGFSVNSITKPYLRLMNTSGNGAFDHLGSMRLCRAALSFASDTLKPGGHFVCKFYQGSTDKQFEAHLKNMFQRVHRVKPTASRDESRESFFVALRRLPGRTFTDTDE
ncbi:FtsJ-like methyltransferase-domain-containing protein [Podospora conica]|nr:FtsJ-like methyltransferase-domain-containing protein [Schizothecium conicum]